VVLFVGLLVTVEAERPNIDRAENRELVDGGPIWLATNHQVRDVAAIE
jgi:hypothetical protein